LLCMVKVERAVCHVRGGGGGGGGGFGGVCVCVCVRIMYTFFVPGDISTPSHDRLNTALPPPPPRSNF